MDAYDINEDTKILILSDVEKQIKKNYRAVKVKYKNNTVSYILDKFHLISILDFLHNLLKNCKYL
ncbi:MAG: hypothetical protein OHM56_08505 [Spiroplasma phoeniceum]|nr:MAG: hypothetical protein OHM57_07910 [Spiroplasma phoeniceum]UZQ31651.1 MAG: hypothetical protein OHM56_08505 [Spiroplasma phoeniceum]